MAILQDYSAYNPSPFSNFFSDDFSSVFSTSLWVCKGNRFFVFGFWKGYLC